MYTSDAINYLKIKFLKIHENQKITRILIKLRKKAYSYFYSLFLLFFFILFKYYDILRYWRGRKRMPNQWFTQKFDWTWITCLEWSPCQTTSGTQITEVCFTSFSYRLLGARSAIKWWDTREVPSWISIFPVKVRNTFTSPKS